MTQGIALAQGNSAFPAAASAAVDTLRLDSLQVQARLPELAVAPAGGLAVLGEIAWPAASISTSGAGIQALAERAAGDAALDIPLKRLEEAARPAEQHDLARATFPQQAQAA